LHHITPVHKIRWRCTGLQPFWFPASRTGRAVVNGAVRDVSALPGFHPAGFVAGGLPAAVPVAAPPTRTPPSTEITLVKYPAGVRGRKATARRKPTCRFKPRPLQRAE
jgi:hypothetical protein